MRNGGEETWESTSHLVFLLNQLKQTFQGCGLKETGAETACFKTDGEYKNIQTKSMRKSMCLFHIKACKHGLIETQIHNKYDFFK